MLKAPGSMLLKLSYDGSVSQFAFNVNLRLYTQAQSARVASGDALAASDEASVRIAAERARELAVMREAGSYTRSLFSST